MRDRQRTRRVHASLPRAKASPACPQALRSRLGKVSPPTLVSQVSIQLLKSQSCSFPHPGHAGKGGASVWLVNAASPAPCTVRRGSAHASVGRCPSLVSLRPTLHKLLGAISLGLQPDHSLPLLRDEPMAKIHHVTQGMLGL